METLATDSPSMGSIGNGQGSMSPPPPAAAPHATASLDGWFTDGKHLYPLRVQYEDTDAGGVVYHANYLAYAERARSAAFTLLGVDQMALLAEQGLAFVVAMLTIRYQRPARLGDILHITTQATAVSKASIGLVQIITSPAAATPIATLDVTIVQARTGKTGGIVRLSQGLMARIGDSFFIAHGAQNCV